MQPGPADITLDARDMEPPEPFVATMDALNSLGPQQRLRLILTREPYPLYQALAKAGFQHQVSKTPQATVEILIWRAPA